MQFWVKPCTFDMACSCLCTSDDELVQALASGVINVHSDDMCAMVRASNLGWTRAVEWIMAAEPTFWRKLPCKFASMGGHVEIVRKLLAHSSVDPSSDESLWWASTSGHVDVVRLLMTDTRVQPEWAMNVKMKVWRVYGRRRSAWYAAVSICDGAPRAASNVKS